MRARPGSFVVWVPLVAIAVGAGVGGHYVGHSVEQLGPIGSAGASSGGLVIEAAIAAIAAALGVAVTRRRSLQTAGVVTAVVWVATVAGTYFAFDTIAGSRDCPGVQDCDTLIVPVLFPFVLAAAVAAALGAAGVLGGARIVQSHLKGQTG